MVYRGWGRVQERESRNFSEKAFRRQSLPEWDARWEALSGQARFFFLNEVKGPVKGQAYRPQQPSVSADKFPPHILKELTGAGFVQVQAARSRAFTDRVVACEDVYDFAARLRSLKRHHLLATDQPSEFERYVRATFYEGEIINAISGVLASARVEDAFNLDTALARYVAHRRWPDWVVRFLNDSLAGRVVEALRDAGGPLTMAELAGRIDRTDPGAVRAAADRLVCYLALVEDLRPETWELVVDFLPAVREEYVRASRPRERPPLVVVEHPREPGPDGSVVVNDLRAFLLEALSEPPRLRQDHGLFQKETARFLATLEPLPEWFLDALKWNDEFRLRQAAGWARALELVREEPDGKELRLQLTPRGRKWLSGGLDGQYAAAYRLLNGPVSHHDLYDPRLRFFAAGIDVYANERPGDTLFLGEPVLAIKLKSGKRMLYYWDINPKDVQDLRNALDRALGALEEGVFYRLDSVTAHLVFEGHNPLNLGVAADEVLVFWGLRPVPSLEEQREEAGRLLLDQFVRRRLIPLGCVATAVDGEGRLAVARQPRCDAYFGRDVAASGFVPAAAAEAKVVVQPDFSVMVIGLNPAPAAELAPFCERTSRGSGQGALTLKITRESVIKAVSQGLKPAEIAERLRRHASHEVPANVLREVQEWSRWVRQVTTATMTVLRCPDRDTADRVMGALKRQAERVNDTLIVIDQKKPTSVERTKLRNHGILVEGHSEVREKKPKARRRW